MMEQKQWLTCPAECAAIYIDYMNRRKIVYREVRSEPGSRCFVLDRKYRPHSWKLDFVTTCQRGVWSGMAKSITALSDEQFDEIVYRALVDCHHYAKQVNQSVERGSVRATAHWLPKPIDCTTFELTQSLERLVEAGQVYVSR